MTTSSGASNPLKPWDSIVYPTQRNSLLLAGAAVTRALDVMVLGFIPQANKILSLLHSRDFFEPGVRTTHFAVPMIWAWQASNSFPDFVDGGEGDRAAVTILEEVLKVKQPDETLEEWSMRNEKQYHRSEWPEESRRHLDNLKAEHAKEAAHLVENGDQKYFLAATDMLLRLGDEVTAEELMKKNLKDLHGPSYARGRGRIIKSPRTWNILVRKLLGKELGINAEEVELYVDEGIRLLGDWFDRAPTSKYTGKSIAELLTTMDNNYVAARKASPSIGGHMSTGSEDPKDVPDTFMQPGASDEVISELKKRLRADDEEEFELPNDYEELLRTTNGLYGSAGPADQTGIFYGAEEVNWDEAIEDSDSKLTLLPWEYLGTNISDKAFGEDWPFCRAFSIGSGGDEGSVWVFEPKSVRKALDVFENGYKKLDEKEKAVVNASIKELYGGLDELRKLEWVVITWYHWNPDPEPYKSIRAYVEYAVDMSQNSRIQGEEEARNKASTEESKREDSDGKEEVESKTGAKRAHENTSHEATGAEDGDMEAKKKRS